MWEGVGGGGEGRRGKSKAQGKKCLFSNTKQRFVEVHEKPWKESNKVSAKDVEELLKERYVGRKMKSQENEKQEERREGNAKVHPKISSSF